MLHHLAGAAIYVAKREDKAGQLRVIRFQINPQINPELSFDDISIVLVY